MKDCQNPEDLIGDSGLPKQFAKQLPERAMQAEGAKFWLHAVTDPQNRGSFPNDESMIKRI